MELADSSQKLTIEEEIYFRSSLDYLFRTYKNAALYGVAETVAKLLMAAAPHHKAVIKYVVLENSEELSIQNIPVRGVDSSPAGIDVVVVCAGANEAEFVNRARQWAGSSVRIFAAVTDTIMLGAVRFGGVDAGDKWPTKMYMLCTSERTGSTMLSALLERTQLLGIPGERFTRFLKQYVDEKVITYGEIVPELLKRYQTPNGVFGVKMHGYQFPILLEALNSLQGASREKIDDLLANTSYIFLVRRNLYEQAISLWRARQTRTYHIYNRPAHKGLSRLLKLMNPRVAAGVIRGLLQERKKAPPPYDYEELRRVLLELIDDRDSWRSFFRNNGVAPLTVTYENFVNDMPATIVDISNYVGVHVPKERTLIEPLSRKMADSYTMEIMQIFKRDLECNDAQLFNKVEQLIGGDIHEE